MRLEAETDGLVEDDWGRDMDPDNYVANREIRTRKHAWECICIEGGPITCFHASPATVS
jgi:hypothetical protein